MIRIVASHSMKVPADEQYSSQGYHVSLEVEVADNLDGSGIRAKTRELFALTKRAVNNELNGSTARNNIPNENGRRIQNQNGSRSPNQASSKQLSYLLSLAKRAGGLKRLQETILTRYGINDLEFISKADCSDLIQELKGGNNANDRR